jgi:hypothetical protein
LENIELGEKVAEKGMRKPKKKRYLASGGWEMDHAEVLNVYF